MFTLSTLLLAFIFTKVNKIISYTWKLNRETKLPVPHLVPPGEVFWPNTVEQVGAVHMYHTT